MLAARARSATSGADVLPISEFQITPPRPETTHANGELKSASDFRLLASGFEFQRFRISGFQILARNLSFLLSKFLLFPVIDAAGVPAHTRWHEASRNYGTAHFISA